MLQFSLVTRLAFIVSCSILMSAQENDEADEFRPKTVINKPFDAIKNVRSFSADADEVDVEDDELVIGIALEGVSRAYPINMLNGPYREIINDTLGETPIAATW